MSKQSKSQCDFGELFPAETTRRVLTVSELTTQVKRLLEKELGLLWVTGEVTNLRVQSSGHVYFTLKDAGAQLNCVLFRGETVENREILQDGRKLAVQGDLTVYESRGQYQLIVGGVELVLLPGRGGSVEDLWAFNEEVVGRATFDAAVLVVSGVGHEIDFAISDFVADARVAAASAAAEIITEGLFASRQFVAGAIN